MTPAVGCTTKTPILLACAVLLSGLLYFFNVSSIAVLGRSMVSSSLVPPHAPRRRRSPEEVPPICGAPYRMAGESTEEPRVGGLGVLPTTSFPSEAIPEGWHPRRDGFPAALFVRRGAVTKSPSTGEEAAASDDTKEGDDHENDWAPLPPGEEQWNPLMVPSASPALMFRPLHDLSRRLNIDWTQCIRRNFAGDTPAAAPKTTAHAEVATNTGIGDATVEPPVLLSVFIGDSHLRGLYSRVCKWVGRALEASHGSTPSTDCRPYGKDKITALWQRHEKKEWPIAGLKQRRRLIALYGSDVGAVMEFLQRQLHGRIRIADWKNAGGKHESDPHDRIDVHFGAVRDIFGLRAHVERAVEENDGKKGPQRRRYERSPYVLRVRLTLSEGTFHLTHDNMAPGEAMALWLAEIERFQNHLLGLMRFYLPLLVNGVRRERSLRSGGGGDTEEHRHRPLQFRFDFQWTVYAMHFYHEMVVNNNTWLDVQELFKNPCPKWPRQDMYRDVAYCVASEGNKRGRRLNAALEQEGGADTDAGAAEPPPVPRNDTDGDDTTTAPATTAAPQVISVSSSFSGATVFDALAVTATAQARECGDGHHFTGSVMDNVGLAFALHFCQPVNYSSLLPVRPSSSSSSPSRPRPPPAMGSETEEEDPTTVTTGAPDARPLPLLPYEARRPRWVVTEKKSVKQVTTTTATPAEQSATGSASGSSDASTTTPQGSNATTIVPSVVSDDDRWNASLAVPCGCLGLRDRLILKDPDFLRGTYRAARQYRLRCNAFVELWAPHKASRKRAKKVRVLEWCPRVDDAHGGAQDGTGEVVVDTHAEGFVRRWAASVLASKAQQTEAPPPSQGGDAAATRTEPASSVGEEPHRP